MFIYLRTFGTAERRWRLGRATSVMLLTGVGLLTGPGVFAARPEPPPIPTIAAPPPPAPRFARTFHVSHFMRGNVHTHTTLSDGTSSPEQTILWYATHGYRFLALTDHNVLSHPERYEALQEPGFILLSGEEVTMTGNGRQVHVNALCTTKRISGGAYPTASIALARAIRSINDQGGVALVNHPNFDWALSPEDVIDAREAPLLEIASGHPYVRTAGDATHLSHEALWDRALSAGADYMGVAVDDVHRINVSGNPQALPGKAWIQVFGEHGDAEAICGALSRGELYSSTGVELRRIEVTPNEYVVEPTYSTVRVTFIGRDGRELARTTVSAGDPAASYTLLGDEGYVRARVDSENGQQAWTPAVRVE